jgi:hypothetical protein
LAKAVSYKVGGGSTEKKLAVVEKNLEEVKNKRDEVLIILQDTIKEEDKQRQILNSNLETLKNTLEQKKQSGSLTQQEQQILEDGIKEQEKLIAESNSKVDEQRQKYKYIEEAVKRVINAKTALIRKQEEANRAIQIEIDNNDELDTTLVSIGNTLGKNSTLYKDHEQRINNIKAVSASILSVVQKNNNLDSDKKEQLLAIVKAYKEQEISVANIQKEVEKGNYTQEQAADLIKQTTDGVEELISRVDLSGKEFKELREVLKGVTGETAAFAKYAEKSQLAFQALDNTMGNLSGLPAMRELGEVIKTNQANTVAFTGAMMALGAAIATAAYKYFGAQNEINRKINFDVEIGEFELQKDLIRNSLQSGFNLTSLPDQEIAIGSNLSFDKKSAKKLKGIDFLQKEIGLQLLESRGKFVTETLPKLEQEVAYSGAKAAISFSDSFQQGAAQFKATAVTARFGEQLAKTGFSAGKLQLAGIDPTQISDAMSKLALETGKVPTAKLGAEMALIAKRTGQSVDGVASLAEYFQRTDNLSSETAVNMVEGMRAMATASKLDLGNLMEGVAEASKDALSYQIKSGEALAKQVAASQSIGVNFNKLASAGRSMVLNYKDSIKSEMQLSSMLGRSVNLSEVRMKAMTGDYAGMMEALKAQGLNPADMNMFEQEALSQALGGMDLGTIDKIFKGEVKTAADLTAGNAGAAGAGFLEKTKQAQASLAADQASISANTAILSANLEQKMQEEFISKFGPGIEQFNAILDSMKKERDMQLENAIKSTQAYSDLETKIEQATQRFDYMGTAINSAIAIVGGGLGAFGANMASGTLLAKRTPTTAPATQTSPKSGKKGGKVTGQKPPKGGKPSPKPTTKGGGMRKNIKRAGVAGLVLGLGYAAYSYFSNKGEEPQEELAQEPEVDKSALQEQLKAEYLQSNATNNVAQQIGVSNDLLKDANSELAYNNKVNALSGVCSCISSNMQESMGMVVDQLKKAREVENFAYKGAYAEQQGGALKDAIDTAYHAAGLHIGLEVGEKGIHTAKHKVEKVLEKRAARKLATEGAEKLATEGVEQVATQTGGKTLLQKGTAYVGQKYTAALTTKALAPLVNASKFMAKGVNPAGWIGVGAEIAGEYMKGRGKEKADKGLYDTGRATQTAGATLAYGAMGATIGSMLLPGIGTAVGAAVGGLYGLTSSLYANYFSEDARKAAAQIEEAEKARLQMEAFNKQIDLLLAIQEPALALNQKEEQHSNQMLGLAKNEDIWRASMLAQTMESTRLLSIIAKDTLTEVSDGKFKDNKGNEVEIGDYDKTKIYKAQIGQLTYDSERQQNIANTLAKFSTSTTGVQQKINIGGEMLNLEEYKKKYKISDNEAIQAERMGQLMQQNQQSLNNNFVQGGNKNVNNVTGGNINTNTNTNTNKNTNTNVQGGGQNVTTDQSGHISTLSGHILVSNTILRQLESFMLAQYTLLATWFGKEEGKSLMATTLNTIATTISTDIATIKSFIETQQLSGGNAEMNVILKQLQMEAHSRGIQMYAADVKQVNNGATLAKEIVNTRVIEQGTNTNTNKLLTLNDTYSSNIEGIQIEMLKTLQDNSELLGAIAKNTLATPDAPIIRLDGKTISNNIVSRQADRAAFNNSRRLNYKK